MTPNETYETLALIKKELDNLACAALISHSLPRTGGDLQALLTELATTSIACDDYFKRFPKEVQDTREAKEEWSRLWNDRDRAMRRVVSYAVAAHNAKLPA